MSILLPRLASDAADRLLEPILQQSPPAFISFDPDNLPPETRFAATGGNIISSNELRDFRTDLEAIATSHGFGGSHGRGSFAQFDAAASGFLATRHFLAGGDSLRDDVWTFFSVILAPDIVHWRFGRAGVRYLGGVRNTFQRLIIRARALDRGPEAADRWELVELLSEDALVQITERPSIGADQQLARQLGEAWVRASHRFGRGSMEGIMRAAILRLRIRNEIRALSALPLEDLKHSLDEFFNAAAVSVGAKERADLLPTGAFSGSADAIDRSVASTTDGQARRGWAIWRRG